MVATNYSRGMGRDAGQRQPISDRAADVGAGRVRAEHADFWRDRSD